MRRHIAQIKKIVSMAIGIVEGNKGKPYYIGHMIAEKYKKNTFSSNLKITN